jgi:hypothetical protein
MIKQLLCNKRTEKNTKIESEYLISDLIILIEINEVAYYWCKSLKTMSRYISLQSMLMINKSMIIFVYVHYLS